MVESKGWKEFKAKYFYISRLIKRMKHLQTFSPIEPWGINPIAPTMLIAKTRVSWEPIANL